MPCAYDDSIERAEDARKEAARIKALAEAFCEAMTLLEQCGHLPSMSDKARKIWAAHEKLEEDRIKQEAMAKLTTRERRILGLDK